MDLVMAPSGAQTLPVDVKGSLPSAGAMGRAVIGFALLGVCGALGGDADAGVASSALVVDVGALVLTGPTLIVGHQVLGLEAPVSALAAALGQAVVRAGELALALCPALLWFAATSGLAPGVLVLFLMGVALIGGTHAWVGLRDAERAAGEPTGRLIRDAKMQTLTLAWMGLTALVGLRLGAHLAGF